MKLWYRKVDRKVVFKVTGQESDRTSIQSQAIWTWIPCFEPLSIKELLTLIQEFTNYKGEKKKENF